MPRFPALEPEPPASSVLRRAGRALLVALAVAALMLGVIALPSALGGTGNHPSAGGSPGAVPAPAGHVVVIDGQHLALTSTRGKLLHRLTGDLRIDPQFATLVPDPQLRRAVTGPAFTFDGPPAGQLVRLDAASSTAPSAVPPGLLRQHGLADEPWLDGGKAVVLVSGDGKQSVGLVDLASGRLTPMGTAATAAGLPDVRGIVVATGGRALPDVEDVFVGSTATRIEVRAPGRRPVVLKELRDLAGAAHLPPDEPLVVDRLSVSRDGRHILVAYDRAAAHEYPQGFENRPRVEPAGVIVVLDRSGRVEAMRPSQPGRRLDWVRWSQRDVVALGEAETTATINNDVRVLSVWDRRTPPAPIVLRHAFDNTLLSPCVWGPRSDHLLCGDDRGWYDVSTTTRKIVDVRDVTGRPLLWLS